MTQKISSQPWTIQDEVRKLLAARKRWIEGFADAADRSLGRTFIERAPELLATLCDKLDQAEADLASISARWDEVGSDDGWWIGGAWGDYGEPVIPLRVLTYIIDGALDQTPQDIDPGFATRYADQVARAVKAESALHDFAEHGTRHDLTPTIPGGNKGITHLLRYIEHIDQSVRDRARQVLDGE